MMVAAYDVRILFDGVVIGTIEDPSTAGGRYDPPYESYVAWMRADPPAAADFVGDVLLENFST